MTRTNNQQGRISKNMNPYLKKCLPYVKKPFVNFSSLHFHPYSWQDGSNEPVILRNTWVRAHWYLNVILFLTYLIFLVCRATLLCLDPAATSSLKVYMVFVTLWYAVGANVQITSVNTRNEFVPFLAKFIRFLQNGERYFPKIWFAIN